MPITAVATAAPATKPSSTRRKRSLPAAVTAANATMPASHASAARRVAAQRDQTLGEREREDEEAAPRGEQRKVAVAEDELVLAEEELADERPESWPRQPRRSRRGR